MPLQNRVDPFGDLHAVPERGMWMGNRGILHDDEQQVIRWARGRLWIICRLSFGGRRRSLMSPGSYTELFFLDEATALAAGHRPCGECRRDDYLRFSRAAVAGNRLSAGGLDARLDRERRHRSARVVDYGAVTDQPDGTMVDLGGRPALWWRGTLRPWSFAGYGDPVPVPDHAVPLLTPR
ncbi:MAG: hypothetical protein AAGK32_06930, partial [Actinomycetota bacterium]